MSEWTTFAERLTFPLGFFRREELSSQPPGLRRAWPARHPHVPRSLPPLPRGAGVRQRGSVSSSRRERMSFLGKRGGWWGGRPGRVLQLGPVGATIFENPFASLT